MTSILNIPIGNLHVTRTYRDAMYFQKGNCTVYPPFFVKEFAKCKEGENKTWVELREFDVEDTSNSKMIAKFSPLGYFSGFCENELSDDYMPPNNGGCAVLFKISKTEYIFSYCPDPGMDEGFHVGLKFPDEDEVVDFTCDDTQHVTIWGKKNVYYQDPDGGLDFFYVKKSELNSTTISGNNLFDLIEEGKGELLQSYENIFENGKLSKIDQWTVI
jgi:hypothetical protein